MEQIVELFFSSEYWQKMLSAEMQAELTKFGLVVGFIWLSMAKRVGRHFSSLETKVGKLEVTAEKLIPLVQELHGIRNEISDFRKEVVYTHRTFDKRITELEATRESHTYQIDELNRINFPKEGV